MKGINIVITLLIIISSFTNCNSSDEVFLDTLEPTISIISPEVGQIFVADWGGAWPKGEYVTLEAKAIDNIEISSINIKVTNSKNEIVFEKNIINTSTTKTELTISESFIAENGDEYSVIFTTSDSNGNITTSKPRIFTYK